MITFFIRHKQKGFTLIETLLAVTILSLSVSGPLYTANRATVLIQLANDRITASYLAQEAVEYVRMTRDSAYLASPSTGWGTFVSDMSACSTSCVVAPHPYPGSIDACSGSSCAALYIENNRYRQGTTPVENATPFTRTIQYAAATDQLTVTVSWTNHGLPYSVQIVEQFRPWQ